MARVPDNGIAENFFRRDGRLNRWRFFKRGILIGLIESVLISVILIISTDSFGQVSTMGNILFKVVCFAGLVPYFCLVTRRLHDLNKNETLAYVYVFLSALTTLFIDLSAMSEPSALQNIISLLGAIIGIYLLFFPGTKGDNQYGSDPLE